MKIGDRVEACGRCFEYYNIVPGASGTIIGKPENYTGYVVEFDGICNKKTYDGSFYITPSCLRPLTYKIAMEGVKTVDPLEIKNVYFNDPVTVAMWNDGTKTIVRCSENDFYDPEKGLAMAIVKKAYGNDNKFHKVFKKWIPDEDVSEKEVPEEDVSEKELILDSVSSASLNTLFRSCAACKHKGQPTNMDPCYTCSRGLIGLMHPCFEPADSED